MSVEDIFVNGILIRQIVVTIIGDGACLFRSLSFHFFFIICIIPLIPKKDARKSVIQLFRVSLIIGITLLPCFKIEMVKLW